MFVFVTDTAKIKQSTKFSERARTTHLSQRAASHQPPHALKEQLHQGQAPDFPSEIAQRSKPRSLRTVKATRARRAPLPLTTVGVLRKTWVPRYFRYLLHENDELDALHTCPHVGASPPFSPATGLQSRSVSVRSFKAATSKRRPSKWSTAATSE